MTPGDVAAGIGVVVIVGCLLSIVAFFLLWLVTSTATVIRAGRRARHRPDLLTRLARGCAVSDLAEIDDELERVLAQEHGRADWIQNGG